MSIFNKSEWFLWELHTSAKGAIDSEGHPYPAGPYIATYIAAALCHALERLALVGKVDDATQGIAMHCHRLQSMTVHRLRFAMHGEALPRFALNGEELSASPGFTWSCWDHNIVHTYIESCEYTDTKQRQSHY